MINEKKPKTKRQKITSVISWIVLGFLVVCVIFVTVSSLTNNIPSFFGYSFLTVKTESMEPTIMTNSVILVDKLQRSEVGNLKEGEIIVYKAVKNGHNITITHTLMENHYEDGYVITKGDAVTKDDGRISVDEVVAVYRKTLPVLSFVVRILSSTVGFILLIILPCLCLIGIQIYQAIYARSHLAAEKAETERIEKLKKEGVEEYLRLQKNADGQPIEDKEIINENETDNQE